MSAQGIPSAQLIANSGVVSQILCGGFRFRRCSAFFARLKISFHAASAWASSVPTFVITTPMIRHEGSVFRLIVIDGQKRPNTFFRPALAGVMLRNRSHAEMRCASLLRSHLSVCSYVFKPSLSRLPCVVTGGRGGRGGGARSSNDRDCGKNARSRRTPRRRVRLLFIPSAHVQLRYSFLRVLVRRASL